MPVHATSARLVAIVAAGSVLAGGCGETPRSGTSVSPAVVRVARATVVAGRVEALTYLGALRAGNEAALAFKTSGVLEIVGPAAGQDWREGDRVRKGQRLARLVQADFLSNLNGARSRHEADRRKADRYRNLLAERLIAQQDFDAVEAAWRSSEASYQQAEQALHDSEIRAPFDGTILAREANAGETIAAAKTVLRLGDLSRMSLEIGVPDHVVGRIEPGQRMAFTVPALEGAPFVGIVSEVAVAAEQGSRLYRVELEVPNADGRLRSGMATSVTFPRGGAAQAEAVVVPLSALVTSTKAGETDRLAVFAVENGRAVERLIRTGDIIGSGIVVTEGVRQGDQVVVAGASGLVDGAAVDARPADRN